MKKSVRKAIIAGNWKMNKTRPEAKELIEAIKPLVANAEGKVEVITCVPFTNLETAVAATAGSNVKVGAENVHFEKSGAFTGEISADMLVEVGVEYVVNTFGLKIQLAHAIEYIPEYDPTPRPCAWGLTPTVSRVTPLPTLHLGTHDHSLQSDLLPTLPQGSHARISRVTTPRPCAWDPISTVCGVTPLPDPEPGLMCPRAPG